MTLMCVHFRHSSTVFIIMNDIMIPFSRFSQVRSTTKNISMCHGSGAISCWVSATMICEHRHGCCDSWSDGTVTVQVGKYFMTKQTDECSIYRTVTCREYTLSRDENSTDPKGWIRGNTKIGPVLEVTTRYLQGNMEWK